MVVLFVLCLGAELFCAVGALCMFSYFIGKIAARSAYVLYVFVASVPGC